MKWVTRARPKTDRIACPWLIRRFIDPAAEIVYVARDEVLPYAERTGATIYIGAAAGAKFSHVPVSDGSEGDAGLDDLPQPTVPTTNAEMSAKRATARSMCRYR